jgi:hypothetical protein
VKVTVVQQLLVTTTLWGCSTGTAAAAPAAAVAVCVVAGMAAAALPAVVHCVGPAVRLGGDGSVLKAGAAAFVAAMGAVQQRHGGGLALAGV